ncbi:hypothetical protein IFM89_013822, partial [Coptis chinensis]
AARCNYDGSSGKKIELKKNDEEDSSNRRGESDGGGGGGDDVVCIEREHMFDKVVTPSDVGKLNRLVIPKQHAEKYFPLDSSSNEKGLLLNFEDRTGKPWRFRYSYWNSSQSYVMTKGWSRFVKEKKLYAGDIVSFQRGAGETVKDRLYIDWRRRSDVQDPGTLPPLPLLHPFSLPRSAPWGGLMMPQTMSMPMPPNDVLWQRLNYEHSLNHQQRTNFSGVPNGYNVVSSGSGPIFYLRSAASQQIGVVQPGGDAPMVVVAVSS